MVQNRVYDAFDGAQPNIGSFNQRLCPLPMDVFGLPAELSCRWWIPSRALAKSAARATYIESRRR